MGDGIGVALEAMRSDARTWETASGDLRGPVDAIGSLQIDPAAFSMWAIDHGVDKTYDEARTALQNMLNQAAEYFQEISTDLNEAANQYEKDDQQGAHGINNSYGMGPR
jgi:hypothetical protein